MIVLFEMATIVPLAWWNDSCYSGCNPEDQFDLMATQSNLWSEEIYGTFGAEIIFDMNGEKCIHTAFILDYLDSYNLQQGQYYLYGSYFHIGDDPALTGAINNSAMIKQGGYFPMTDA